MPRWRACILLSTVNFLSYAAGFELGHEYEGKTRGLWMWAKDEGDHYLVAVDCEGLFDVRNNDKTDAELGTVAILLSSYFIVNVLHKLDATILAKLRFSSARPVT